MFIRDSAQHMESRQRNSLFKAEVRQKYTPSLLNEERNKEEISISYRGHFLWVLFKGLPWCGLCLPLANDLVSFCTFELLPSLWAQLFLRRTRMQWPVRGRSTFVMGCCPPTIWTSNEPSYAYIVREVSLTLGVTHLSLLRQKSAPAISFVLGVSRENKASILFHLTNTSCPG